MSIDLAVATAVMVEAAREAAACIAQKGRYPTATATATEKSRHGELVTVYDLEAESIIAKRLAQAFPGIGIVGEEGSQREIRRKETAFYIDPIDGTLNFFHGLAFAAVSIGLLVDGVPVAGVVLSPFLGEEFSAYRGGGAVRNGTPLFVSSRANISEALFATGWPYDKALTAATATTAARVCERSREVRILGSAALSTCYVASGVLDGFWETGLQPWDLVGGASIALEAGAVVSNGEGGAFSVHAGDVLVASPLIHGQLLDVVKEKNKRR